MKITDKETIKRILLITLSNIGDIVLTTPVASALKREFPRARLDVMSGPAGKEIFARHPLVRNHIVYDKRAGVRAQQRLIAFLRKKKYDLIVDLRNSLFPVLIGSRYRTSLLRQPPFSLKHKKDAHLWRLGTIGIRTQDAPFAFYVDERSDDLVRRLLEDIKITGNFVVVSPGAKSHIKRWSAEGFASVCDRLSSEAGVDVLLVGDAHDSKIAQRILSLGKRKVIDLTGKLSLRQLGALIRRARLLITNDSAPLHIGSALGTPVLAIFGPTDPAQYGPLSKGDVVLQKNLVCSPCEAAQCRRQHECMGLISSDEVVAKAKEMLSR
ncbi:MAG: glycosyltransferase family 9 protein [Candidatus Omnitrophota bacterium]